jgi:formaldehyde-activating enzyme involved in methanogenesis
MAVMDSVAGVLIPKAKAEELLITVTVFVEWDAKDKKKVHDGNYEATKLAIRRAVLHEPGADEILFKEGFRKTSLQLKNIQTVLFYRVQHSTAILPCSRERPGTLPSGAGGGRVL